MSECKYKRHDGVCECLSDDEVKEYCMEGPCMAFEPVKYIREDDVQKMICRICLCSDICERTGEENCHKLFDSIQRVNIREVVNCSDCKSCKKEDNHEYWCFAWGPAQLVPPDGWCFRAKKEQEGNQDYG